MKERSRRGLGERPRWAVEEARLLERKSEVGALRVVVEEESEWVVAGEETTREMRGAEPSGMEGGRIVDTEAPLERTDCECVGGSGTDLGDAGDDVSWAGEDLGCGDGLRGEGCLTVDAEDEVELEDE